MKMKTQYQDLRDAIKAAVKRKFNNTKCIF